ncbi:hypothetical protein [Clostridium sp. BJN0001]|uniref:hypothetical protein n=1 Tax=Clostridium sp. BJN0001 TaxID=2930219 RepID=UPI001FD02693|nr:hypothetical protein [Clostridium sp. BJN0001]
MAKHKHRDQEKSQGDNNNGFNNSSSPFQIDPMNIISMLSGGNLDINSLLSQMNMNGFNMGALSPFAGMAGLNNNGFNNNNSNINNNEDETDTIFDGKNEDLTEKNLDLDREYIDENIEFLVNLKKFVHPDRIRFIDQIIKFYKEGKFKKNKE